MLTTVYTQQFDRDVKRMKRQGKNLDKLKIIIRSLLREGRIKIRPVNEGERVQKIQSMEITQGGQKR